MAAALDQSAISIEDSSFSMDETSDLSTAVSNNVVKMSEDANKGAGMLNEMKSAMSDLNQSGVKISEIKDVEGKTTLQAKGMKEISNTVDQMDSSTQRNASLVEQLASAAKDLSLVAKHLCKEVSEFKVSGSNIDFKKICNDSTLEPPPVTDNKKSKESEDNYFEEF